MDNLLVVTELMLEQAETKLTKEQAKNAKLVEALKNIVHPIPCPACTYSGCLREDLPCYCFEDFNDPRCIARAALKENQATSGNVELDSKDEDGSS